MNILITAGPTREYIDDVRYISNRSSGRMGYAIAFAAQEAGHQVTLISGPTSLTAGDGITVHCLTTSEEMHAKVMAEIDKHEVFIATAAVADFKLRQRVKGKLKKATFNGRLDLVPTVDILAEVGRLYGGKKLLIGFALESEDGEANALNKMRDKRLDAILLNDPTSLDSEHSKVLIMLPDGRRFPIGPAKKFVIARELIKLMPNFRRG